MGRAPCCSQVGLDRGSWTAREDKLLINYIRAHGEGHWRSLPKKAGLLRCGKSCRLRWMNYLRPDIKRGNITPDEDDLVIRPMPFSETAGHSLAEDYRAELIMKSRIIGTPISAKDSIGTPISATDSTNTSGKRSSSSESKEKKKNDKNKEGNQGTANGKTTKTKIDLPKAVRVTSVSITRTSSTNSMRGSSSSHAGRGDTEVHNLPWLGMGYSNLEAGNGINDGEPLPCNKNHNLVDGYAPSCQNYISTDENVLDEMFEEYEQLRKTDNYAQLDSFIDSLLA
ncbi:hypothetical protein P3X46_030210 [Hevea brasiliensis]|uniref:Uncharacterized protein n=1 Tax=Hevea brasiliensis TaxID=3981 RepID=A0ABQ9KVJ2_HEVBR|nr:hypothetical protein P3X46_030210 [Hevea brasiliensis]